MKVAPALSLRRFPTSWSPRELRGQRVLLVGLGTFGGGIGAARWLLEGGVELTVTDLREESELGDAPAELAAAGARLVLGGHEVGDLARTDWIVASPAVPLDSPFLQRAGERGVPVETEISLLCRSLPCPWVGITGTNGKSTTASLTARAIEVTGRRVFEGGNMGGSLLPRLVEMGADDVVVLELSSFQLEHLAEMGLGPPVAVVTNLSPDHLDRHGDLAAYARAKRGILARASVAVLPADDPVVSRWGEGQVARRVFFGAEREGAEPCVFARGSTLVRRGPDGEETADLEEFPLLGEHNRRNLAAAAAVAELFGARFDGVVSSSRSARPLRSRLETVAVVDGVRFVDDGVSTSPPAVVAALRAFDEPVHLLLGGYDKGIEIGALLDELSRRDVRTYMFGAVALTVDEALREREVRGDLEARQNGMAPPARTVHQDLVSAFESACREAGPGEVVLLSPGFASYDQFLNFGERVELFRSLVSRRRA